MCKNKELGLAILELSISLILLLPLVLLSVDLNNFYLEKENINTALNQEIKKMVLTGNAELTYANSRFDLVPNYLLIQKEFVKYLNNTKNNSKIDEVNAELACDNIFDKTQTNINNKKYENIFIYNKSQDEFKSIHQENFKRIVGRKEIEKNFNEVGIRSRFCSFVVCNVYKPKTYLLLSALSPNVLKIYSNRSFFINFNL